MPVWLALQNGFGPAQHSTAQLSCSTAREKCNKYDLTCSSLFLIGHGGGLIDSSAVQLEEKSVINMI
jgi:hypothetical protein